MPGTDALAAEFTHISPQGLWVLLGDEELAVHCVDFLWFKNATVEQLLAAERPTANHLYWPQPDIDLAGDSLRHPGTFPMASEVGG